MCAPARAFQTQDFVAWHQAHVVGFSMGGMIATKLVAEAADRCHSVTLLSVSQGGWDVLPRSWRALKIGVLVSQRTPARRDAWPARGNQLRQWGVAAWRVC